MRRIDLSISSGLSCFMANLDGTERLSAVAENYLLALFILKEEGLRSSLAQLADYLRTRVPEGEGLGTSLPTVTGMVRRMERENLVQTSANKEVQLTDRGLVLAEDMVRRHRLAERLVVDLLGVSLADAHVEAHRLEHAISPGLLIKIVDRLGNPSTCPFGRPIPGSGHPPEAVDAIPLDSAPLGERFVIDRIPEEDHDLLTFLVGSGVLPDAEVRISDAARYRGVMDLVVDGRPPVTLGYEVASRVWVRPVVDNSR
jgi:DtxR family Mn-dependent transcriptional regulator